VSESDKTDGDDDVVEERWDNASVENDVECDICAKVADNLNHGTEDDSKPNRNHWLSGVWKKESKRTWNIPRSRKGEHLSSVRESKDEGRRKQN